MQDINNDARIEQMKLWFEGEFDIVEIAYDSFEKKWGVIGCRACIIKLAPYHQRKAAHPSKHLHRK